MSASGFKLVLSRKGFDSGSGGCASPMFPNGRLYTLPISYEPGSTKQYAEIGSTAEIDGSDMGTVVEQLTKGRTKRTDFVHLDPDIDPEAVPRDLGWRGSFGQCEAAQVHLVNQRVGVGDVFLFHGWFRAVQRDREGRWCFQPDAPDISVIFGWLQVGEVIDVEREGSQSVIERHPWLRHHPHLNFPSHVRLEPRANAIYVAAEKLCLPGVTHGGISGSGVFRQFSASLLLTASGASGRSVWKLPSWFKGDAQRPGLTQYPRPEWWTDAPGGSVLLQPRGRQGQEAVLDCAARPEAGPWIASLFG